MVPGTVLIVEDDVDQRESMVRLLSRMDFVISAVATGKAALQALSGKRYDLTFLDLHLPEMDGLALMRKIHQLHPDVALVILTGNASLESAVEAVRLGAHDYLIKPIAPHTLLERTRSILQKQTASRRKLELQTQIAVLQSELSGLRPDRQATTSGEYQSVKTARASSERYLSRGQLVIDLYNRSARLAERLLDLAPTSFDYLVTLAQHAPNTVTYYDLVVQSQGYVCEPWEAKEIVKWHIHRLRQTLEPDGRNPQYVINLRGKGYRLVMD